MPYRIEYMPDAVDHLRGLTARDQAIVLDRIKDQLTHEPGVPTRNRKPLRPNSIAPWELRIGEVRVFYDFAHTPEQVVSVVAIGVKQGNQLWIGGEVVEL